MKQIKIECYQNEHQCIKFVYFQNTHTVKHGHDTMLMDEINKIVYFQNTHAVKHGHDTMLMEMERLNMHLKEEQNRVLTLQNELKFGTTNNRKLIEVGITSG